MCVCVCVQGGTKRKKMNECMPGRITLYQETKKCSSLDGIKGDSFSPF